MATIEITSFYSCLFKSVLEKKGAQITMYAHNALV